MCDGQYDVRDTINYTDTDVFVCVNVCVCEQESDSIVDGDEDGYIIFFFCIDIMFLLPFFPHSSSQKKITLILQKIVSFSSTNEVYTYLKSPWNFADSQTWLEKPQTKYQNIYFIQPTLSFWQTVTMLDHDLNIWTELRSIWCVSEWSGWHRGYIA